MKKIKYLYILILILFILPLNIKAAAASISGVSIEGNDGVSVGTSFYESFAVRFSNIKKGTSDTEGIWIVGFEIDYDDDAFVVEDILDNGKVWNSNIYKSGNKKYVISQFNNSTFNVDACVDKVLYCADYMITIKFYVKDTDQKTTTIKMKDIEAGVFQVSGALNPEYNADDVIELEYSSDKTKNISINKPKKVDVKEKESIVSNSKPKVNTSTVSSKKTTNKTTNSNSKTTNKKSDNNNLKDLAVSGYSLNFAKDTTAYTISVKEDVNSLKIKALPENDKATVKVEGNEDIKLSEGKITISVKAENGNEKTYTIDVQTEKNIPKEEKGFKLTKEQITIGGIIIGSILLIIIIIFIIFRIRDRKIEKNLDSI